MNASRITIPETFLACTALIVYGAAIEGFLKMAPLGIVLLHMVGRLPLVGFLNHYCTHKVLVMN